MNHLILEKKANEFRSSHGFNSNESIRLKSLLQKLNVQTVFKPLSAGFSGMALKVGTDVATKRFILINSSKTIGHQHFTICHELYHLFIQEEFTSQVCMAGVFDKKDKEEFNADVFAANILLPENGIKSLIPDNELIKDKISMATILKIEHYFSCSRKALLRRLKDLGIISNKNWDRFAINVKRSAFEFGYSTKLYESGNDNDVIGDYGSLARNMFDSELISESHYYSLLFDLGMNNHEIESLENGDE